MKQFLIVLDLTFILYLEINQNYKWFDYYIILIK